MQPLNVEPDVKPDVKRYYLFPALVGAGLSLFLLRTGVFAFFFLVPLGFVAYRFDYKSAWAAFLFAFVGNLLLARASRGISLADALWDIAYYGLMALIFTGITAPPPALSGRLKGYARFFCGSCLGALLLSYLFMQASSSPEFAEYFGYLLSVFFQANSSQDVVQNAVFGGLSAELILEYVRTIMLRGGSLVSCVLLFAICRQLSLFLARLAFRRGGAPSIEASSLSLFHVNPVVIWVFSASLFLVVLARIASLEIIEIILWNILVLCVIMYFTQGLGIFQFLFARLALSTFPKVLLLALLVIILFSPFLNVLLLGGLFLLGVVENWVPLRAPKNSGPPSTPEAGDDEN